MKGGDVSSTEQTLGVIDRFNEAFNTHDVDAIMALMTDDVIFDNTTPPDGQRFEGQVAVREFWEKFFGANPGAWFDSEDTFAGGDRCTVRWIFTFDKDDPTKGHVKGVDVFKVRDGKVAEKLSYVKG
jgi:ketosteroid isomerase-like protein